MRGVLEFEGASSAMEKLTKNGLAWEDLRDWLRAIAELEKLQQRPQRKLKYARIAGVPLYKFDRLPKQLRRWAKEILDLNAGLPKLP